MRRPSCRQWAAIAGDSRRVVELDGDHQPSPRTWRMPGSMACSSRSPVVSCSPRATTPSRNPGAVRTSMVARAAAHPIGFPPYVPPWLPFGQRSSSSRRVPRADSGKPERDPLGHADDVGLDVVVVDREHPPGATEPGLHLVGDEEDAVGPAALDDAAEERRRRRAVAALTEHRLEDHRRRLGGCGHRRQAGGRVPTARGRPRHPGRAPADRGTGRRTRPTAVGRARRGSAVFDVVIAIVMWVRPWNDPANTMTLGRPVACLASLTAASVISAPELAKKNVSIAPGPTH